MMTRMEASILAAMGDEPTPPCVLYATATGELPVDVDEVVRVHISNIRKKLAELGLSKAIVTVHGKGYVWAPEGYTKPKPTHTPYIQRGQCAWCGAAFEEPYERSRPPFRYCVEHRTRLFRQRVAWLRRRAA